MEGKDHYWDTILFLSNFSEKIFFIFIFPFHIFALLILIFSDLKMISTYLANDDCYRSDQLLPLFCYEQGIVL